MISTETTLAGYHFDNCFMNAAGVYCYDAAELNQVQASMAGTFVTKSATVMPRSGNPEPRYQPTRLGSINSMGLPNEGLPYYLDYVSQQQKAVPDKTYFQSITGFNIEEDEQLLAQISASDFKGVVELNLSCPNVPGKP